jgi:biotin/methionine sulfoxide reductase
MSINGAHWGMFHPHVEDGRLVAVEPFERDPNPSDLIRGMPAAVHALNRVAQPAIRRGWLDGKKGGRGADAFVHVSWDEALDAIERELRRVKDQHGNEAIFAGSYGWASAGRFHHAQTQLKRFLNTIGGFVDQVQTYSYAAGQTICPHVTGDNRILFGGVSTTWPAILANANFIVCFGGLNLHNAKIASGGAAAHATRGWVEQAGTKHIDILAIGPTRETLEDAAHCEWLPLRPCTDTALMLGIAHTLVDEDLHDRAFLDKYTHGYARFEPYLLGASDGKPKSAEWAANITAVPAQRIKELARKMARSKTFLTGSWSLQRQDAGEQPMWMMITLAAMLGQIGLPGRGVAFGYGSMGNRGEPRAHVSSPSMPSLGNPLRRYIPVARLADMLLNPGKQIAYNGATLTYPEAKIVWYAGGNPFHHHQDLNNLVRALQRPETIIVNELWWTAMAKHADIVLPACTTLERNDLSGAPTDRFVVALKKQIEPVGQARPEYAIFSELARRFGTLETFTEGRDEMGWLRWIYDDFRARAERIDIELPHFDAFWAQGYAELPQRPLEYTLFEDFRRDPGAHALKTPSGKFEIYSDKIASFNYADTPAHPTWIEPQEWLGNAGNEMLHLVSTQPPTRLHGQLDGVGVSKQSKLNGREPVFMHPQDASARGIVDGTLVELSNARGRCLASAVLSENVMSGVVQLPTGAWYEAAEPGIPDSLEVHGNPNVLTPNHPTSSLSQAPAHHSTLVAVRRYNDLPPPVRAHEPPRFESAAGGASNPAVPDPRITLR